MSDYLLRLARHRAARSTVSRLGLPIPMPQELARGEGDLAGAHALVAGPDGELHPYLAPCLARLGLHVHFVGSLDAADPYIQAGEAFSRRASVVEDGLDEAVQIMIIDGTRLGTVASLEALYDALHGTVRKLDRCGRLVVLGREPEQAQSLEGAASQAALEGFVRSMGKELGRKGSTANLVRVGEGAEARLSPVLAWLVSPRSAFVSGQVLHVSALAVGDVPEATPRPLAQRRILLTGAARGIGRATAGRLAEAGATVYCLDRPDDDGLLDEVATNVGGVAVPLDLTDPDAPATLAALAASCGGLHGVVHNAGITRDRTLAKMHIDSWRLTLDVNLGAILRAHDALDAHLLDGASVVLLSSIAGIAGNVGQSNYAASKAGVIGFVHQLAPRLAARGIRVNAVAPGFIETRLTAAIPMATREAGRRLSSLAQGGLPVDVAEAITFLQDPRAVGLTDGILRVCGQSFIGA